MKEKVFITLICAGCGISFPKDKKLYEEKRRWGRQDFYCKGRCALDSRMARLKANSK